MNAWKHTCILLTATALLLSTGCAQSLKKNPAKEEAKVRWEQMRAKVRLQLADRNFETGQTDDALQLCQEVIALDPVNIDGYLLLTRIQLEKGQTGEAEAALDAATGLNQPSAELDYLRGMLAERREQPNDARDWYKQAYDAKPNEPDYLVALAESLLATEDLDEAVQLLSARQQDFEQDVRVQILVGQALNMAGRYREAADAYLAVIRLAPHDSMLREEAGITLLSAGRVAEAETVLEPLLASKSDKPSASVLQALASAMIETDRTQRAIGILEAAVKDNSQSYALWLQLGKACLLTDRPVQAEDAVRRACKLKPDSLDAQLLLVCCQLAAGNRSEARIKAQELIVAHPNDPLAMALLQKTLTPDP